jgi:hypothetical protein
MKRLTKEIENNEKKILASNEKYKNLLKEIEEVKVDNRQERIKYEESIKDIIRQSSEIVINMKNTLEIDLSDENIQQEVYNKIREMIGILTKEDPLSKWLSELRSFINKSLSSFLDIIFKQIHLDGVFSSQKIKWQNTLDQISLSHEEEIKKSKIL